MIWTWLVSKVSGISLKFWGYLAAFFAVLAALAKVYSAGKNAEKVTELAKNEGIKDAQLEAAVDRPNSNSDLDSRLRDPAREF